MRYILRTSIFFGALLALGVLASFNSDAQITSGTDVNLSQKGEHDSECAIGKNPANRLQLFAACNTANEGLFASRSTDGGVTWTFPDPTDKTIADGDAGQGPAACCDPTIAWDSFGNLFLTYLNDNGDNVVTLISTDGGATFNDLASFGPASVDQPTVVVANTTAAGAPGAIWIVWNQGGEMVARGAAITGVSAVGAFGAMQTIPGADGCSFGDVAISPAGVVVQTCETQIGSPQGNENIIVNIDADGLGPGNFGPAIIATSTNVGSLDRIPAQVNFGIDAEPSLAYDNNAASPHFGRLYMVYTDELIDENDDTDIMLRFSDNDGATWSDPPIRVNDDTTNRSQFLPRAFVNSDSGNIAICWHDARNSTSNTAMQEFCTISNRDLFPDFIGVNARVGDAASISSGTPNPGPGLRAIHFGDYSGLTYFRGIAHPIWADSSNSTGNNPDGNTRFDAYSDRVVGGSAANEGDPHLTTVNGVNYDFQSAGEFTVLRGSDGLEIQTRQTPVSTTSTAGPNDHTGLTTCVSINTAVAARVGEHRVTYQPNLSGVPDPQGLELRIDGKLQKLDAGGIGLGADGRVAKAGDGIQIEFPDGTILVATPHYWNSYQVWYMNVNVYKTSAVLGVLGAVTSDTWLPRMPDRSSLGPKPATTHERYLILYEKFADAWRVTNMTSLFDYAPGTSTSTFTLDPWPMENQQCVLPDKAPVKPLDRQTAQTLCGPVLDRQRKANCIFDVIVTGEPGFAKLYLKAERTRIGLTVVYLSADKDRSKLGEIVTFTALVRRSLSRIRGAPAGTVQFFVDGERAGDPRNLDRSGRAEWKIGYLKSGRHQITAQFIPPPRSAVMGGMSSELGHVVKD